MKAPQRILAILFLLFIVQFTLSSCIREPEPPAVVIGISKGAPATYYGNYSSWLKHTDTSLTCLDLYHMPLDSALKKLSCCSGLLISGGPDVFPGRYGRAGDTLLCGSIDLYRDSLEFALIEKAKEMGMPILGICRGLQIFNIYQGGSLYADLPSEPGSDIIHRCPDTYNCFHSVSVAEGSGLHHTSGLLSGTVNSNHHQGIRKLGTGLSAVAFTGDSLIESIEYLDSDNMPFFMGVQWHPERMDLQNPLSLPIAMFFIQEARLFSMQHVATP